MQTRGSLVKKIAVGVADGAVLLVGIAMMVLPGPAFVVIPIGLAILATEFPWARRWLVKMRRKGKQAMARYRERHPHDGKSHWWDAFSPFKSRVRRADRNPG